ncbi:hypothetical protein FHR20_004036 [Sphingomonas leidyi]|uniref:Uncharacterized protein n=1 Tax=Sphingomonas leidyi TaxID=68569 RepID=A0A7X5V3G5_9SPHN|nr:hypothetical protein [Sphingomonas leidyi]
MRPLSGATTRVKPRSSWRARRLASAAATCAAPERSAARRCSSSSWLAARWATSASERAYSVCALASVALAWATCAAA